MTLYTSTGNKDIEELVPSEFTKLVSDILKDIPGYEIVEDLDTRTLIIAEDQEGKKIHFTTKEKKKTKDKAKIYVSAHLKWGEYRFYNYVSGLKNHKTEIGCSGEKSASAIAKDVNKKLLPVYNKIWDECISVIKAEITKDEKRKNKTSQLAEICKAFSHQNKDYSFYLNTELKHDISERYQINSPAPKKVDIDCTVHLEDEYNVDQAELKIKMPFELAEEFFVWMSERVNNCFEVWESKMKKQCLEDFNKKRAINNEHKLDKLPENNLDWFEFYNKSGGSTDYTTFINLFGMFEASITGIQQPTPTQKADNTDDDNLLSDDEKEVRELFDDSKELEIFTRLLIPVSQCVDEIQRLKDRRFLVKKIFLVRKMISQNYISPVNTKHKRALAILEKIEIMQKQDRIDVLTAQIKGVYPSFRNAKIALNIKAKSWEVLVNNYAMSAYAKAS